jgi:hypothetical protein
MAKRKNRPRVTTKRPKKVVQRKGKSKGPSKAKKRRRPMKAMPLPVVLTDEQARALFLEWLGQTANVSLSCQQAGIPRQTVYDWRSADQDFAMAWEKAHRLGSEAIEDEIVRRGVQGVEEPVFYQGQAVASVRRYSDPLLLAAAKARLPHYRDRTQISGDPSAPLQVHHEHRAIPDLPDEFRRLSTAEQLRRYRDAMAAESGDRSTAPPGPA